LDVIRAMSTRAGNLVSEIRSLPEEEKLKVLDALLTDLDKWDPEIDGVWAIEARRRWEAYQRDEVPDSFV